MPAIRAAAAGPRALGGDGQTTRVLARDLFDAAARPRTELVHAPFYGGRCVILQTSGPHPLNPRKERESPEIVQRCPERELGGFRLDAVALTCDRGWRRPSTRARETEAEPQDGDAGIDILLDGAPDHIPEARELGWRFIRLAPGIVLGAGAGHALGNE